MSNIGRPLPRVDGRLKVTGAARYAADWKLPGLLYGYVVSSEIARGRIVRIDAAEALAVDGVVQVLTHENAPKLARANSKYQDDIAPPGKPLRPLHSAEIQFFGQPIALVVADSFERARYAASIVRVTYEAAPHATDLAAARGQQRKPRKRTLIDKPVKPRGNAKKAFAAAQIKHEAEYGAPAEHHNPMEPFAATVEYGSDGKLVIHEKTQGPQNDQRYLDGVFDLEEGEARILAPFVGGGFGAGLRPQYDLFLAVLAARTLKRSVRVTLTRQQMFTLGHRPTTLQRVALGLDAGGNLSALIHEAVSETSRFEDYNENCVNWSASLYACDNMALDHKVVELDINTPLDMRAPGAGWGLWALESAMDELAHRAEMDPLVLREINYAETDPAHERPFSSKELRACYRLGAEKFGWAGRSPEPRSMKDGHQLVGWGMATGVWEANQMPAMARAVLGVDGTLVVGSATTDIGPGTYTAMTQIAADALGLPMEAVRFELGDAALPFAPVQGGSFTTATVGSAVKAACDDVRDELLEHAAELLEVEAETLELVDGQVRSADGPALSIREIMQRAGVQAIEKVSGGVPNAAKQSRVTRNAHSAVFVEVKVDEDLGTIEVSRVVSAIAAGRIINPQLVRSQIMGGVVWGISMALHEHTVMDHRLGRPINPNFAEYHLPVNADIHAIDVVLVEEHDEIVNPLGVKGVGELGLVGVAAAVANAVFHATGVRVRELPITLDKLLGL